MLFIYFFRGFCYRSREGWILINDLAWIGLIEALRLIMIGILDSGMGGLITARALRQEWPAEDIVYFGDTARAPYGNKSLEVIRNFAADGAAFLQAQGAGLIVVACHTIAGVAGQHLAAAMGVPVVDGIVPAVERAVSVSKKGWVGIIGSPALAESGRYPEIISHLAPQTRLFFANCPLLVPLINAGWIRKPESVMIVKKCLHSLKTRQIDTLILANPYFSILKRIIQRKIGRRVTLVDPTETLVDKLRHIISASKDRISANDDAHRLACWVTDLSAESSRMAPILYGKNVSLKQV